MRLIDNLECHGQLIERGTQVAYVGPTTWETTRGPVGLQGEVRMTVTPGRLKVARVVDIIADSLGFADYDGTYRLVLDNTDKVDVHDVAVTDGKFQWGTRG